MNVQQISNPQEKSNRIITFLYFYLKTSFQIFHLYYKYFNYLNEDIPPDNVALTYALDDGLRFLKTNCLETVRRFHKICYPDEQFKLDKVTNKTINNIRDVLSKKDRIFICVTYYDTKIKVGHIIAVINLHNLTSILESASMSYEKKLFTVSSGFVPDMLSKPNIKLLSVCIYSIPPDEVVEFNIQKILSRSSTLVSPFKEINEAMLSNDSTKLDKERIIKTLDKKLLNFLKKDISQLNQ